MAVTATGCHYELEVPHRGPRRPREGPHQGPYRRRRGHRRGRCDGRNVGGRDRDRAQELSDQVMALLAAAMPPGHNPTIEEIQDVVEKVLIENGHATVAKAYILYRDEVFALTQNLWAQWKIWANSTLYWLNMGIKMGKLAGNDLIPAPDLALSCAISPQIPDWALSYEQAIQYLRRNEISTDPEFKASKGWHTVSYQNRRLGWVKIIQDRATITGR